MTTPLKWQSEPKSEIEFVAVILMATLIGVCGIDRHWLSLASRKLERKFPSVPTDKSQGRHHIHDLSRL
ncbi:MAG: hypothetical protein ABFS45_09805 [Pseudomonadota bacterium]